MKPLPSLRDWFSDSWKLFWTHRQDLSIVSAWFLVLSFGQLAVVALERFSPALAGFGLPLRLAIAVLTLWTAIRAMRTTVALDRSGRVDIRTEASESWKILFPMLWVTILQFIVVMGGLFLVILPGIYLGILLMFAPLEVLAGERSFGALSASARLIKGRWWAVLGRSLASSAVLMAAGFVFMVAAFFLIGLIAGPQKLGYAASIAQADPFIDAIFGVLNGILLWLLLPLSLCLQVRLWRDLKDRQ